MVAFPVYSEEALRQHRAAQAARWRLSGGAPKPPAGPASFPVHRRLPAPDREPTPPPAPANPAPERSEASTGGPNVDLLVAFQRGGMNAEQAKSALDSYENAQRFLSRSMSVKTVKRAVCARFGISEAEITGPARPHRLTRPRQVAMYLAKTLTSRSMPEIGRQFGNRDHTTVLHAFRVTAARMEIDEELAATVRSLIEELTARDGGGRA